MAQMIEQSHQLVPDVRAYREQCKEDLERFLRTANSHPLGRGGNWAFWALLDSLMRGIPEEPR